MDRGRGIGVALAGALAGAMLAGTACEGEGSSAPHHLYVSQTATGSVAVIDPASGETVRRIPVGMLPHQLLATPSGTLLVVLTGSQAVAELDPATATVRRTFLTGPVPEARDDGTRIEGHFTQGAFTRTSCADCHGAPGGPLPRYAGERPFALLVSADGRRLLVAHVRSGVLAELDLASGAVLRRIPLAPAGEAREAVALARAGDEVLVALRPTPPSTAPAVIRRLDAASLEPRGDVLVGSDPGALLAADGRALVSNFEADTITPVGPAGAGAPLTVAPGPMGLTPLPGGEVLVMGHYSDAVSRLDPALGTARTAPLQGQGRRYPNPTHAALSPDGRTAYVVSGGTDGHLLDLDPDRLEVRRAFPIDGLSFDVAVVPGPPPRATGTRTQEHR
ncbi:MAG: hypothetical protein QM767_26500 [Anaeromyxobacter sp.]